MNELQIRISADIANLQAALNKAKTSIKSFEESTDKESEKSNVGFRRKIGLIEELTNKAKTLRTALSQATNEKDVERYNKELERTTQELTRLNALGRTLGNASTDKESEKSNVGFTRKIGLIEALTNKAKTLRTALSQATNEKDVERYNKELERTTQELTRLNDLGRTLGNASTGAAGGINKLATAQGNANGVAIEFNRIIQDAPFGLIGIGNNLQQLTASFSQVSQSAGGAGAAIRASLGALISPANLLVLGISAVTAAFTAYQMGAFDFLKSNEAAAKSVNELADEIDNAISRTSSEQTNINSLRSVIEDETLARDKRLAAIDRLQNKYPEIFGNADREKLLNGQLIQSYDLLTKAIIQRAEASLAEETIPQLNKEKQVVDNQIQSLQRKLALEEAILKATSKGPAASGLSVVTGSTAGAGQGFDAFAVQEAKVADLNKEIDALSVKSKGLDINIQGFAQSIISYQEEFVNLLEPINLGIDNVNNGLQGQEKDLFNLVAVLDDYALKVQNALDLLTGQEKIDNDPLGISQALAQSGPPIKEFADVFQEDAKKVVDTNQILVDSFGALGTQIANSLGIANNGLRAFISTVLTSAPKIIQAIIQQAAAKKAADASIIAGNAQVAGSEAIASGAKAANALGPVGLALLPVFIGGALAIISGAFSKIGGSKGGVSGGGVSGSGSGAPPQIFTNAGASLPAQTRPSGFGGSIDQSNAQGRLYVDLEYDKLRFFLDEGKRRRGQG